MDFSTLCKALDIKPEDGTELDQVQRFITFCNEARRAPCFYPGLGRLYDEMANPLPKQSGRRRRIVVRVMRANSKRRRRPQPEEKGLALVIAHKSRGKKTEKLPLPGPSLTLSSLSALDSERE